ncbi:MAG: DUF4115 domain-containing protein [Methylotenera sp.]|uniref:helix-turn-helix domain-containing protein n=1 Tax=Methylotenera sp. TaxID=2051956 RepID=UPI002489C7E4|nr:RodZ domain-containing protein [Methylotenera sp.]MDI1308128.1 DUF4115 domain-containing protein [Methylotenera sp.]
MADEAVANFTEVEMIGFAPLGEVFFDARNAKNLSLKDVSNNLRFSIKQIEALENNNFSSLPPAAITRGFIRNYARYLELDAEPLLASYRVRMPDVTPGTLIVKTSMNQVMPGKGGSSSLLKYLLLFSLVLLATATMFYYINYMQKPMNKVAEDLVNTPIEAMVPEVAMLPEVALPEAERVTQTDTVDAEAAENVPAEVNGDVTAIPSQVMPNQATASAAVTRPEQTQQSSGSMVTTQNLQMPKEAAVDFNTFKENAAKTTPPTASAKASATDAKAPELANNGLKPNSVTAAVVKSVNIAVTEQTWVRITDKHGEVVYEKMLKANSEDGFNGLPPFKMLIGNAKATKLTFSGQNVDLSDKTKSNVARLTLE